MRGPLVTFLIRLIEFEKLKTGTKFIAKPYLPQLSRMIFEYSIMDDISLFFFSTMFIYSNCIRYSNCFPHICGSYDHSHKLYRISSDLRSQICVGAFSTGVGDYLGIMRVVAFWLIFFPFCPQARDLLRVNVSFFRVLYSSHFKLILHYTRFIFKA